MKKIALFLILIAGLLFPTLARAESIKITPDFSTMFDEHGAMMLLIGPETGSILYANNAAALFYGYSKAQLETMNIDQINTLTPEEIAIEMQAAADAQRNFFVFRHRLYSGEIRTVEVFSYPVASNGQTVLFSIIHDITEKMRLEERGRQAAIGINIAATAAVLALLFMLLLLSRSNKRLASSKAEVERSNALRKTFFDADDSLIYLKDENLNYVFVNKALEAFYQMPAEKIIGGDDFALSVEEFAQKRRQTDLAVLKTQALTIDEVVWEDKIYQAIKFPVSLPNGKIGVGAHIHNITEEREYKARQERALQRNKILLDVFNRSFPSMHAQLDHVLHELLKLSASEYGYIYLYDQSTEEFTLNSWTKGVMENCSIPNAPHKYKLGDTGIWGEAVRQRKPIIVNDFEQPHPLKKGYPAGHVQLKSYMSIPVIIGGNIVAVVGLANKRGKYDDHDVYELTLLMSGIWSAVQRRSALETLSYERNKYLQTLISIGDGVMVVDQNGNIEMLNKVAQKLTGWTLEEAQGRHYKEVFILSHEQPGLTISDPVEGVFATDQVQELENHALLISRNGGQYYLEDSAAPIKDDMNNTVGVVLVFRDVSDKKEQRKKIEYLSFHDSLTGLYNRRFFEEELLRSDTERNLPISIIMGDVNSLKLTNDIFGHAFGDMLLEKVAGVLQSICRADDVIARWGGDEFVLLLPKTPLEETEKIVQKIKDSFAKEHIRAIRGSISMGFNVKSTMSEDLLQVLNSAEENMYAAKTLERDEVRSRAIDAITAALYHNSSRERDHSIRVSELCQALGRKLKLSEVKMRKLKEAGYLHDIGKIVLEPKLLNKNHRLTPQEWSEVKRHPIVGYRILNFFDDTLDLAESVLTHHEKWDGSGYPKGLKGEEIPLLARIISVVEGFDRMTHDSDNTTAMSEEQALREIREHAGTQFDPVLAETFARMMEAKNPRKPEDATD